MLNLECKPILEGNTVLREESFGGLLYNRVTSACFVLNETSFYILNMCNGKNTVKTIADEVTRIFSGDKRSMESDVLRFLGSLLRSGVLNEG